MTGPIHSAERTTKASPVARGLGCVLKLAVAGALIPSSACWQIVGGCGIVGEPCPFESRCLDLRRSEECLNSGCGDEMSRKEVECGTGSACVLWDDVEGRCQPNSPPGAAVRKACPAQLVPFGPPSGPIRLTRLTAGRGPEIAFLDGGLKLARGLDQPEIEAPEVELVVDGATHFETGDIDGDGREEIAFARPVGADLELGIVRADGGDELRTEVLDVRLSGLSELRLADLNASGALDLVAVDYAGRLSVVLDPLTSPVLVERQVSIARPGVAVLVQGHAGQGVIVLDTGSLAGFSVEAGELVERVLAPAEDGQQAVLAADFDQDGQDDLAMVVPPDQVVVRLAPGFEDRIVSSFPIGDTPLPGQTGKPQASGEAALPGAVVVADVGSWSALSPDREGSPDLLGVRRDGRVLVLFGWNGSFNSRALTHEWVGLGNALATGDIDGDGTLDLVVSSLPNPHLDPREHWVAESPVLSVSTTPCWETQ